MTVATVRGSVSSVAVIVAALLAGPAAADTNRAVLSQTGTNAASITQSGRGNSAGTVERALRQEGSGNTLTITQSGEGNDIGDSTVGVTVGLVQQSEDEAPATGNSATIRQLTDGNAVSALQQIARAGAAGNALEITQDGGDDNVLRVVRQESEDGAPRNRATIEMTGAGNRIDSVTQITRTSGALSGAAGNDLDTVLTGSGNGEGSFEAGGFASRTGVGQGELAQGTGAGVQDRLDLALSVTGQDNRFGTRQSGIDVAAEIAVTGANNQIAVDQRGIALDTVAQVAGSGNDIGMVQDGAAMAVSVTVMGDDNAFGIDQRGAGSVAQSITVTIDGDNNGFASGTGGPGDSFSGGAAHAATHPLAATLGFERGMIRQDGVDQTLTLDVTGSFNAFGFLQDGSFNEIDGRQDGISNEAAVIQSGSSNVVHFEQRGSLNTLGVVQ